MLESSFKISAALEGPADPVPRVFEGSILAGGGGIHASVTCASALTRLASYLLFAMSSLFCSTNSIFFLAAPL